MSRSAASALTRSCRTERVLTALLGLVALLAGAGALVVGAGLLGRARAHGPLLDPRLVDLVRREPVLARAAAVLAGLLLVVIGLRWAFRALRPEPHPDLVLQEGLTVTSGAVAEAVRADAEEVDGVLRARVTVVGRPDDPVLRLSLWLRQGTDVRAVWRELDERVLGPIRSALGVLELPAAVRLELAAEERHRVRQRVR
jgi:hypothetical protein